MRASASRFRVMRWLYDEQARAYVDGDFPWSLTCSEVRREIDAWWFLWYGGRYWSQQEKAY